MEKLFQEYDADCSDNLDLIEVSKLLRKIAIESGQGASEAEVSWILKAAGKQRQNIIDINELKAVLQLWGSYVRNRAKVESVFDKYDTRRSQSLDFDQLKRYFSDLDGCPPKVRQGPNCRHLLPSITPFSFISCALTSRN
jgi:Ca2+-binding EF-hand superfamily protein